MERPPIFFPCSTRRESLFFKPVNEPATLLSRYFYQSKHFWWSAELKAALLLLSFSRRDSSRRAAREGVEAEHDEQSFLDRYQVANTSPSVDTFFRLPIPAKATPCEERKGRGDAMKE